MSKRTCSAEDCDRRHYAKGFCTTHYWASRYQYKPQRLPVPKTPKTLKTPRLCIVEGCNNRHKAKGFCLRHYTNFKRNGNPIPITEAKSLVLVPTWRKGMPTYRAIHGRVEKRFGSAKLYVCVDCGEQAKDWSYTGLDEDEIIIKRQGRVIPYSLNLDFYQARCGSCHKRYDLRIREMRRRRKSMTGQPVV